MKSLFKLTHLLKASTLFFAFILIMFSCKKDDLDQVSSIKDEMFASLAQLASTTVNYFPEEVLTITSKEPLVKDLSLTNKNDRYFQDFIVIVQNGNNAKTKVQRVEILIDGVTIITNSDFRRNTNIVSKSFVKLTPTSTLSIIIDGSRGRFIKVSVQCSLQPGVITDIDGNYYHTVLIGNRWWTVENLRVTRFNDGTPIQLKTDNIPWVDWSYEDPAMYRFYNNDVSFKDVYGLLYNHTVSAGTLYHKEVCPTDWHLSKYEDFWDAVLSLKPDATYPYELYIGGEFKEAGLAHWQSPNTGATNSTGFTALPAGTWRDSYFGLGYSSSWWLGYGEYFTLAADVNELFYSYDSYDGGKSIRCVKNH